MVYPQYTSNGELITLLHRLENIVDTCRKFLPTMRILVKNHEIENWQVRQEIANILEEFRGHLRSSAKGSATPSLNSRVLKQLSGKKAIDYDWNGKYALLIQNLKELNYAGDNFLYSDNGNKKEYLNIFCNTILDLKNSTRDFFRNAFKLMPKGEIDYCVLPTKNKMDNVPNVGTLLGIDIPNTQYFSNDDLEKIKDEARRVAFQSEAWEWTDESKPESLFFLFVDHVEDPIIQHNECALVTALEIISRITFKFVISPDDSDGGADSDYKKHQFQQLRLVLYSYGGGRGEINNTKTILYDPKFKYHNTIMVIGDKLFNELNERAQTYKLNFIKTLNNHPILREPIYWSTPIGWGTLKLFLQGSRFLSEMKRNQRAFRYQAPGQIETQVRRKKPAKNSNALVFDISTTGARLLFKADKELLEQYFDPGTEITFGKTNCQKDILNRRSATVVYRKLANIDSTYIGVRFKSKCHLQNLHEFLHKCNFECNSIC